MQAFFSFIATCWVAFVAVELASAEVMYSVTDLGTFGGTSSAATSINDHGQIVGRWEAVADEWHAFLYDRGTVTDLGTLGGKSASATSISNSGLIVGTAKGPDNLNVGFLYDGTMHALMAGSLRLLGAYGVNDAGQVAGFASISGEGKSLTRAVLYSGDSIAEIPTPAGFRSYARSINNQGQVVGWYDKPWVGGTETRSFVYSDGKLIDLGTLYGDAPPEVPFTAAIATNDQGQIVGFGSARNGKDHAFLYHNGRMEDLGTLTGNYSIAGAINERGQIVGCFGDSFGSPSPFQHGFVYSNGVMVDLNDLIDPQSGWMIYDASDINNGGLITASGVKDGVTHALLLTPIPEPGVAALAGSVIVLAGMLRRRPHPH